MAQADSELANVEDGQAERHGSGANAEHTTSHGSEAPYMPHLALSQEELERLHPSLVPPEDEQLDDLVTDERDVVYQKGLQFAEAIRSETSLHGRMRRPLLACVTEQQQQHDGSSKQCRTRTIRPFGGGVIRGATTSTTIQQLLPGTTHNTTTTHGTTEVVVVGAAARVVAATAVTGGGVEDAEGEGNEDNEDGSDRIDVVIVPFGSYTQALCEIISRANK